MEEKIIVQRPAAVNLALSVAWSSLGLGVVKLLADFSHLVALGALGLSIVTLAIIFALLAFLIFKLSRGRNWARIVFLVMFVVGLVPMWPMVVDEFSRSTLVGLLSVLQTGLQGLTLVLVFTRPGSLWFRKGAQEVLTNNSNNDAPKDGARFS